jgi:translation initiation factor 1A
MSTAKKGGKGQKAKKRGGNIQLSKRSLDLKEEGQEYALVTKMFGGGRLEANCCDGKVRNCHIRGTMMKRIWIAVGDTVLVSLRDFQDDKADVIHKYTPDEVRMLQKEGHIAERIDPGYSSDPEKDENFASLVSFENI